jgi:hypothetical protein
MYLEPSNPALAERLAVSELEQRATNIVALGIYQRRQTIRPPAEIQLVRIVEGLLVRKIGANP